MTLTILTKEAAPLTGAVDGDWSHALTRCGDAMRQDQVDGVRAGTSPEARVNAQSYTLKQAAKLIEVTPETMRDAARDLALDSFVDPHGALRFPARTFESTAADPDMREMIAGCERLRLDDLRKALGARGQARLRRSGLKGKSVIWRDARGLWGLPESYAEFRQLLEGKSEPKPGGKRRRRRRRRRGAQARLRDRLIDAFPKWRYPYRETQQIYLHIGEPNSGKTHDALEALKEAGSGWYLAPLRLLAYEIFDRLNGAGVKCSLLTGEEHIPVDGALITAATIEMFNPMRSGECVIIDEAQMLADADRGWAWTRAMMECAAPEMHIIGPPTSRKLIQVLAEAADIPCELVEHQRLAPIAVAERHHTLESLPPHTILVAFSRRDVLELKMKLERLGRAVSVVYGSLPPEVRRRQADRFAAGETEICVATDAVGMGLNLPADVVCFYETEKFDGKSERPLTPAEVHQIGGRAGRFGLSKTGLISAASPSDLAVIKEQYDSVPPTLEFARVAPTADDLKLIPGGLVEQLTQWAALESIPAELRAVITTSDLVERIELAKMLSQEEIERMGLAHALQLISAPARKTTRRYWLDCAHMIMEGYQIPLPPQPPFPIANSADLEETEHAIACADIYLWLANRKEFGGFCEAQYEVREERREWSLSIDEALLHNLDMTRLCYVCGARLPSGHRYRVCERCFRRRRRRRR